MRWPWSSKQQPALAQPPAVPPAVPDPEAGKALEQAREWLEQARRRSGEVDSVVARMRELRAQNRFAEAIAETFREAR